MSNLLLDNRLDLRGVRCPTTFLMTKIRIERLECGQLLELILDDGEPVKNVPRSVEEEGHEIIATNRLEDGSFSVLVKKLVA